MSNRATTSTIRKKSSPRSPCRTISSPSSNCMGSSASATVCSSHVAKFSVFKVTEINVYTAPVSPRHTGTASWMLWKCRGKTFMFNSFCWTEDACTKAAGSQVKSGRTLQKEHHQSNSYSSVIISKFKKNSDLLKIKLHFQNFYPIEHSVIFSLFVTNCSN